MPQPVTSVPSGPVWVAHFVHIKPQGDDSAEGAKSATANEREDLSYGQRLSFSSRLQENRKAIGLMAK